MLFLQSPSLTFANLFVGGTTRFFCWIGLLAAAIAISPVVGYGVRHPELHIFERQDDNLLLSILLLLAGTGVWLVYEAREPLEKVRKFLDGIATAPARRRLESARKPLVLDDPR